MLLNVLKFIFCMSEHTFPVLLYAFLKRLSVWVPDNKLQRIKEKADLFKKELYVSNILNFIQDGSTKHGSSCAYICFIIEVSEHCSVYKKAFSRISFTKNKEQNILIVEHLSNKY